MTESCRATFMSSLKKKGNYTQLKNLINAIKYPDTWRHERSLILLCWPWWPVWLSGCVRRLVCTTVLSAGGRYPSTHRHESWSGSRHWCTVFHSQSRHTDGPSFSPQPGTLQVRHRYYSGPKQPVREGTLTSSDRQNLQVVELIAGWEMKGDKSKLLSKISDGLIKLW